MINWRFGLRATTSLIGPGPVNSPATGPATVNDDGYSSLSQLTPDGEPAEHCADRTPY